MNRIFYNKDGWVCDRYPQDISSKESVGHIDIDDEVFEKTHFTDDDFAWRVIKGKLVNERYRETPPEVILESIRAQREEECFSIINRGQPWYSRLNEKQIKELDVWYNAWLDATRTNIIPQKPNWL